jgi:tripartite-type tricarboxylate transporter receptor subunit TctC
MPVPLHRRALLGIGSVALMFPGVAGAETWPNRPVRLVVPFPAGGTTDTAARLLAEQLSRELDQQVIVDNRGGASGTIGTGAVAHAAPDGYTLLFGGIADQVIAPLIIHDLPYDPLAGLAPVSLLSRAPSLLLVHPEVPARTVEEFVTIARSHPGKLTFASAGIGNTSHLLAELFKRDAEIDATIVPYKGNGPASNDLMAGHVQAMFGSPISAGAAIATGRLRALAVTTERRLPTLPEVPTFVEAGLPGMVAYSWSCLLVPAATPADIVARLNGAVEASLHRPEFQRRMQELDSSVVGGPPAVLTAFLASERKRWGKVVESTDIKGTE